MKKIKIIEKFLFVLILLVTLSSIKLTAQETLIVATLRADTISQIEDIQYSSIQISQVIDFDKLIRVYINSGSIIMIDNSVTKMDHVGNIVYEKLKSNIDLQVNDWTHESLKNSSNDLKILIRKSAFTNKDDYRTMLDKVNNALWDLMNYFSNKVYGKEYKLLNTEQRSNIKKLIPFKNYLAEDVKF